MAGKGQGKSVWWDQDSRDKVSIFQAKHRIGSYSEAANVLTAIGYEVYEGAEENPKYAEMVERWAAEVWARRQDNREAAAATALAARSHHEGADKLIAKSRPETKTSAKPPAARGGKEKAL